MAGTVDAANSEYILLEYMDKTIVHGRFHSSKRQRFVLRVLLGHHLHQLSVVLPVTFLQGLKQRRTQKD